MLLATLPLLFATGGLVPLLVTVLVFLIVVSLIYWLITQFAPEPLRRYGVAIVIVIAVIFVLYFLMENFAGGGTGLKM